MHEGKSGWHIWRWARVKSRGGWQHNQNSCCGLVYQLGLGGRELCIGRRRCAGDVYQRNRRGRVKASKEEVQAWIPHSGDQVVANTVPMIRLDSASADQRNNGESAVQSLDLIQR